MSVEKKEILLKCSECDCSKSFPNIHSDIKKKYFTIVGGILCLVAILLNCLSMQYAFIRINNLEDQVRTLETNFKDAIEIQQKLLENPNYLDVSKIVKSIFKN